VEVVISPDHKVFSHTTAQGLAEGGTFMLQSNLPLLEVGASSRPRAQNHPRQRLKFFVIDAFASPKRHAPTARSRNPA